MKKKVKVTWPNGSSLTGWLVDIENGGQNIAFGRDNQWAVMYRVPEGDEHFPAGIFEGFAEATVEYEEPQEFGTIIHARFIENDEPCLWTRFGTQWVNSDGVVIHWFQFDPESVSIIQNGASA